VALWLIEAYDTSTAPVSAGLIHLRGQPVILDNTASRKYHMATFRIYGAHGESGEQVVETITADRPEDAEIIASARKIMVSRIVEVETRAAPSAVEPEPKPNQSAAFHELSDQSAQAQKRREYEVWRGHPSQWTNFGVFVVAGLFFWLFFPVLIAIIRYLKTNSTTYVLTNQRLKIESGLLGRDIEEVELYRVKDSSLIRSLIDKLRNTGTIRLDTSDRTTPTIWLRCIPAAPRVREQLRSLVEARREAKRVREVDYA